MRNGYYGFGYPEAPLQFLFGYDLFSSYRDYNILPKKEVHSSLWVDSI